jgi:HK97 family phage portal protein
MSAVPNYRGGWRRILESFPGAWQRNVEVSQGDLVCYPTLYACIMRKSSDMGKLPFLLMQTQDNGISKPIDNPAYTPVLRKPNNYQTAQQFREVWCISKLTQGNTYVLKRRDARGVVVALYVLDPCRVMPMVTESGQVYYQLYTDPLKTLPSDYPADRLLVPASEIIHDRCVCIHHPLIGVPPLCAAYWPTVKNLKILQSSATFFGNNSQPGGILTAPVGMSDEDAQRVRDYWQTAYTGDNAGKVAVIGADMKFTSFAMKGADSQLVEQMQYSDRQICQPFGIPPYIVGVGEIPAGLKVDDVMNTYYSLGLQSDIEAMENLLTEGLNVTKPLSIEMDLEPLLRMDTAKRGDVWGKLVSDGISTPNEARQQFELPPLEGGNTVYMQQQDIPLDQARLNKIPADANANPAPKNEQTPQASAEDDNTEEVRSLRAELWQRKAIDATREALHAA